MCVSLIFFVTGTAFCMGHARIIAGFNTMSPKELKEYDLDRISVFSGICWLVMSLILFHVSVSLRIFGENTHGIGLSFIATIAVLLFWTVCITGSGKIPQ